MLINLLRRYLGRYRRQVCLVVALLAVQAVANLYLPNLTADIINNGIETGDIHYIWRTGGLMLAVTFAVVLMAVVAVYFASKVSMGIGRDIRAAVFKAVQRFSAQEINHFGTPSLITRNTNDVQQIQLFLQMALTMMVLAPIMCVGGVFMALKEDVRLSTLLVVAVPLLLVIILLLFWKAVPLFRSMQARIDRVNLVLREQITGVRVIRAFVRTSQEKERFAEANAALTNTGLRVNRMFALALPAVMAVMNLSSVAVLWFGGHLIASGSMPIGNLTAFLSYILQILMSVMIAVMMIILLPRAVASADRIEEVLRAEPAVVDPPEPIVPSTSTGLVELRDVVFEYPGGEKPVLHGLSFSLVPGDTTAIIGGTGSGKTTVLNLIPRLFDVTSGAVIVDGVDVRDQARSNLWAKIGMVPQQAYLFSGTVADNLRFGRAEASDEELWHALEVAQARDFVEAMPGGLEAQITQAGTNVSGGQRQRLSIARALVKRPSIYLFDDCFSALDAGTDAKLRAALRVETRHATVMIVAQRVSTILHADRIIVLDEGRVVGIGSHEELLSSCPAYREIVISQLGEEAA
ncbi:MAG: ABC transporter ATP-binding protein [Acidimicrobiales bacterium]|jgi:ATP-binding cassette subfamily B protein